MRFLDLGIEIKEKEVGEGNYLIAEDYRLKSQLIAFTENTD